MRIPTALVLAGALLTGCAHSVARDDTDPAAYAPDDLLLSISLGGGGPLPGDHVDPPPAWALYGDGRVLHPPPRPESLRWPPAAFDEYVIGRVDERTRDRIVAAAREAGIDGTDRDYGDVNVVDGQTTTFRLRNGTSYAVAAVYGLGVDHPTGNQPRDDLAELHRKVLGNEFGPLRDEGTFGPVRLAVVAQSPYRLAASRHAGRVAWEGPPLAPGHPLGAAGTCGVVAGDSLERVLPAVRASNILTRWTHAGKTWRLRFRALLPHERTCADALG